MQPEPLKIERSASRRFRKAMIYLLLFLVIPGWSEGPDPESRGSGFDASHRPGTTDYPLGTSQFATTRPAVDETAVTKAPQLTSTAATAQLQFFNSASEGRSKVA